MQNTPQLCFFAFSVDFIIRFSVNKFPKDSSGHYSVKCHVWEKVYLLSYEAKSYWPVRLHDFSECSFSLTTRLFGMIVINILSVLEVLPVALEIKKETLLLVIVYRVPGPLGTFIADLMLLISELPTQRRVLIVGNFNLD